MSGKRSQVVRRFGFGGLTATSDGLVETLSVCESVFLQRFNELMHVRGVLNRLVTDILNRDVFAWFFGPPECCSRLCEVVKGYIRMRIFHAVKYINQDLCRVKKRNKEPKKNRKLAKLSHIQDRTRNNF